MDQDKISHALFGAQRITERLSGAYWTVDKDSWIRKFLIKRAAHELRDIAGIMGHHITSFETPVVDAITDLIDAFECEDDEIDAILSRVAEVYRERNANAAEAYWTERNTFDDALARKCSADAAMNAARALK